MPLQRQPGGSTVPDRCHRTVSRRSHRPLEGEMKRLLSVIAAVARALAAAGVPK